MRVLVLNPGSSTLKAAVLEPPDRAPVASVEIDVGGDDATGGRDRRADVGRAIAELGPAAAAETIEAVGYRVVHGGTRFREPARIDDAVVGAIDELASLAPLHNPVAAATIRAGRAALPGAIHVAAFDTAFHATLPDDAIRYAVPARWVEDWGVRRFGFHGLSVAWSTRRAAELLERPVDSASLVVAHLGSGCSVTAVAAGRSVETSMGMTPLEGLVMGTRAGSIDPGILLGLLRDGRRSVDELAADLDDHSGLLGLSGRSADVRQLLTAEDQGDDAARLALAVFVRRAAAGIAAAASALDRLDAIVFTGGIGANSGPIRRRILDRLAVLGIEPRVADEAGRPDEPSRDRLVTGHTGPAVVRVHAREDVVIAEAVVDVAAAR